MTGVPKFQSTPSGGKATTFRRIRADEVISFNPRLPGGRRPSSLRSTKTERTFQSTPSGGKATPSPPLWFDLDRVSIHAFRGEGDRPARCFGRPRRSFNPRLPGGRRRTGFGSSACGLAFQSTPSGGKATASPDEPPPRRRVSIHAFRGEGDTLRIWSALKSFDVSIHAFRGEGDRGRIDPRPKAFWFQSTPSGGKATARCRPRPRAQSFNPRLPGGRRL